MQGPMAITGPALHSLNICNYPIMASCARHEQSSIKFFAAITG
jgi:hypothetical protein